MPEVKEGDRVQYRVLRNPLSAPEQDYVAQAIVLDVNADGTLGLLVMPRRSDPFQIGDVVFIGDRDEGSDRFQVWEPIEGAPEVRS